MPAKYASIRDIFVKIFKTLNNYTLFKTNINVEQTFLNKIYLSKNIAHFHSPTPIIFLTHTTYLGRYINKCSTQLYLFL